MWMPGDFQDREMETPGLQHSDPAVDLLLIALHIGATIRTQSLPNRSQVCRSRAGGDEESEPGSLWEIMILIIIFVACGRL